eukprot:scaffold82054_cov28-Tisochrysis_lutea.AAC.1
MLLQRVSRRLPSPSALSVWGAALEPRQRSSENSQAGQREDRTRQVQREAVAVRSWPLAGGRKRKNEGRGMETMAQQRRDEEEICEVITVQADSEREKGREWCGRGESERDAEWDEGDGVGPARWESERRANPSSPAVRRRACEVPFDALPINWTSTLTLLRSTRTHSLTGFAGVSRVKAGRGYVYAATCRTPVDRALRRLGSYRDVRTAALAVALAAAEPTIGSRPALAREWIERIGAGEPPPALTRVNTLSSSSTNAIMPLKSVVALTAGPSSEEVEAMAATEGLCLARDSRSLSGFRGVRRRVQVSARARTLGC